MNLTVKRIVLASALLSVGGAVCAYEAGDMVLRFGAAAVDPQEDSDQVLGMTAGVGSDTQLGITGTYMLTDQIGLGLLAATPFTHEVTLSAGIKAGEVTHLPPTLTVQYFFLQNSAFQPYAGVGLNYTWIYDEEADAELKAALSDPGLSLELDDSIGLAAQVGFDYSIDENWGVGAAIWYLDIGTQATVNPSSGGGVDFDVDIDPFVYMVGATYKF